MERRAFLKTTVALTHFLAARRLHSAPKLVRAAVVIGVNKSGDLPVLGAAASGAEMVADWLAAEQFEVRRFATAPITVQPVYDAVAALVGRGTLDQLVVYFSGHGFLKDGSEMWMLSGAPGNANEAVSLRESIELARESAIPSVVFISDACRSTPDSLQAGRVRGSVIFPNAPLSRGVRPEVDRFLAALPGDPALELPVATTPGRSEGIFTSSFLSAFKNPENGMVRKLDDIDVVPNRNLKAYLLNDVPRRARAKSIQLQQLPDTIVESGDVTYIGRVARVGTLGPPPPPGTVLPTVSDLVTAELTRTGVGPLTSSPRVLDAQELSKVKVQSGFGEARRAIMDATGPQSFETQTGFSVNGATVAAASAGPGMFAELLQAGDGGQTPAIIRMQPQQNAPATSVWLRFSDGSGTVLAGLNGYIGTVVVVDGRVVSVNYLPSRNSWRWEGSDQERRRLEDLRATVATAARLGGFRIEGNATERMANGRRLADRIRVLKAVDPTLGLYAAYAYADAGIRDQVRSVRNIMRGDLSADIFDVAMLAGGISDDAPDYRRSVVPICPMLSQGWSFLRVRQARLLPEVERARDHLLPALWTTFDPQGMEFLQAAIRGLG